ncbi:class I SAM-dependent methyltransferase [Kordia jejudonensis]|uniref:class I SAM-dependent methyltransferase n=1 Tax=Kordia jejudonensis TaxID=1348245 RepID=UPI0006297631|nr:class I SAM-dependent methyltransferase [Kordia jejudonensis]
MDEKYQETFNTWNTIAQLYEDVFMDLTLYNDTYVLFCESLSKNDATILEIGCGPGNITKHISTLLPKSEIIATDVAEAMIVLAKKNNPSVNCTVLDARNITEINQKFDGIMCGFIIPYLSKIDCARLIADCSKLVNPDGILYISFVAGKYADSGFISGSTGNRTYFYYHEVETIQTVLKTFDFSIVSMIEKEYQKSDGNLEIHTIIIAKK